MRHPLGLLTATLVLAALPLGCRNSETSGSESEETPGPSAIGEAEAAEPTGGSRPDEPAPTADQGGEQERWVEIESLGLRILMPGPAVVRPGPGDSMIVRSNGLCTVTVGPTMDGYPSYESSVRRIELGLLDIPGEVLRYEIKNDGWELEYTQVNLRDHTRFNTGVDVRKRIRGEEQRCGDMTYSPEETACVLAACRSLEALVQAP